MSVVEVPEAPTYYVPTFSAHIAPPPAAPDVMPYAPPAPDVYYAAPAPTPSMIYAPPAPAVYQAAPMAVPPMPLASVIRVVSEKGQDRLEIHNSSFARMTCESLNLKVPGCEAFQVEADHHQVALSCENLEAVADRMTTDHQGQVILQGHVKLM